MAGRFGEEEGAQIRLIGELKVAMEEQKKTIVREFFIFHANGALIYGFSPAAPYVRSARQRITASECRILPASRCDEQGLCPCAASRLSHD